MFELLRAVSPYITLLLTVITGLVAWIVRDLVKQIEDLRKHAVDNERYIQERYVTQEQFYHRLGENQRVMENIFSQLNHISATLNQMVGENRAYEAVRKDMVKFEKGKDT